MTERKDFRTRTTLGSSQTMGWSLLVGFVLVLVPNSALAQYNVRITQVDRTRFPKIGVYVSITDAGGNPIVDSLPVHISILEGGRLVFQSALSDGQKISGPTDSRGPVSLVLVLDRSGSMQGEKLQKAKDAAIAYLNDAPPQFQLAVVAFDDDARTLSDFTNDKSILRARVGELVTGGGTALQDGIATGLDMLRGRSGRRAVLALTDGLENSSKQYQNEEGYRRLLERASKEDCTISTVGLGRDVNTNYLKGYEATGGWYLFSPGPDELKTKFELVGQLIQAEWFVEYDTPFRDPDGSRRQLSVILDVSGQEIRPPDVQYVSPGVIPNVRGNHMPYLVILMALLCAPSIWDLATVFRSVRRFRSRHLVRLKPGSSHVGKRDANVGSTGPPFAIGDLVIQCPDCETPHYVRSWRMNRCRCMRENRGMGHCCYHRKFPRWLRRMLDFLSGAREGEMGRAWFCRCAGDTEGY